MRPEGSHLGWRPEGSHLGWRPEGSPLGGEAPGRNPGWALIKQSRCPPPGFRVAPSGLQKRGVRSPDEGRRPESGGGTLKKQSRCPPPDSALLHPGYKSAGFVARMEAPGRNPGGTLKKQSRCPPRIPRCSIRATRASCNPSIALFIIR